MAADYTVEDYVRLRSIPELSKRFYNIELLARVWVSERDRLKRCLDEPHFLLEEFNRWNAKVTDIADEAQNILVAIEILKTGG